VKRLTLIALVLAACGDDGGHNNDGTKYPLDYADPPSGGALLLVKNTGASTPTSVALDLIVGAQPLTGYSAGFNLPLAAGLATFSSFRSGTALDPGSAPAAAQGMVPTAGPLAGVLVAGVSQKAAGTGAVPDDTKLEPGAVLFSLQFDLIDGAAPGPVFDGTAPGFVLPSGGLRDRAGMTVVEPQNVSIGKLQVNPPS
jgi:hypothetical protein